MGDRGSQEALDLLHDDLGGCVSWYGDQLDQSSGTRQITVRLEWVEDGRKG